MSRSPAPLPEIGDSSALVEAHERHSAPLRLLTAGAEMRAALPVLATAGDVRELVQYLKKKPAGVAIVEALDDVKRRVFEPRKVAAYEAWGLVTRTGDRLQLSEFGREFAAGLEPETAAYRALINRTEGYSAALAWIFEENLELVTHADVTSFWQQHDAAVTLEEGEKISEGCAVSFFHLCQAAELGTMTTGKRGQPSRLRVEREELARFIAGRTHASQRVAPETPSAVADDFESDARGVAAGKLRVLVSGTGRTCVLAQVETALELAEIEFRTAIARQRPMHALIGVEALRVMRECDAALFVITVADFCGASDEAQFDQSLFVEIVAAYTLYAGRVLLLCEEPLRLPAHLDNLARMSFGGGELTWNEGIRLTRAVKEFRRAATQD